jgi:hypothetical protein
MIFTPLHDRIATDSPERMCWRCNHSLRGLPGRFCPQCGAQRHTNDHETADSKRGCVSLWAQRFLAPPKTGFHASLTASCATALVAAAVPGGLAPAAGIALGSLTLLGLWWSVRAALYLLTLVLIRPRTGPCGAGRRFAIAPIVVVVTMGMIALGLPSRVLFRLSRPAMDRWVERVMCGDRSAAREQWIGVYPAREISFTEDGVWFRVPWTMAKGGSGFLFSPREQPVTTGEMTFRRRGGGWYEWSYDSRVERRIRAPKRGEDAFGWRQTL